MQKIILAAVLATMVVTSGSATAGPPPAKKCQAGKNQAAGKYDACAANAEKTLALTADTGKYDAAIAKCEQTLVASWSKLEAAAVAAGMTCPTAGDQSSIRHFVDGCAQSVASAVAGGDLGLDPLTCNTTLSACTGNLTTANGNLGFCSGMLTTMNAALASCTGELSTTNADLSACTGNLSATNADLGACAGNLSTTNADLGACTGNLSATNADLGACAGNLTTTNSDLGTCSSGLAACLTSLGGPLKTGQTTCYDAAGALIDCAGTGQDGELQEGVARGFTDNGDGTVTDNVTGLMWEKLSDDGSIHDVDDGYSWEDAFPSKIATLNSGNFAGHNDWRVPNVTELQTLVNFRAMNPPATYLAFDADCVDGCTNVSCSCSRSPNYWTSSTFQQNRSAAWYVDFLGGQTLGNDKANSLVVRAVRTGS